MSYSQEMFDERLHAESLLNAVFYDQSYSHRLCVNRILVSYCVMNSIFSSIFESSDLYPIFGEIGLYFFSMSHMSVLKKDGDMNFAMGFPILNFKMFG